MGRRTILLIVAALIAVAGGRHGLPLRPGGRRPRQGSAGAGRGAQGRGRRSNPGRPSPRPPPPASSSWRRCRASRPSTAPSSEIGASGPLTALTRIFPKEQITASKFGSPSERTSWRCRTASSPSRCSLSDTGRVAGFVSPGSHVAIFLNGPVGPAGRGRHPPAAARRPDRRRGPDHRHAQPPPRRRKARRPPSQLPNDAVHPRGRPERGREGHVRLDPRRALLRPAQRQVQGEARPWCHPAEPVRVS